MTEGEFDKDEERIAHEVTRGWIESKRVVDTIKGAGINPGTALRALVEQATMGVGARRGDMVVAAPTERAEVAAIGVVTDLGLDPYDPEQLEEGHKALIELKLFLDKLPKKDS